jgi:hypothetical protein
MGVQNHILRSSNTSLPVRQAWISLSLTVTLSVVEESADIQVFEIDSFQLKKRFHLNPI